MAVTVKVDEMSLVFTSSEIDSLDDWQSQAQHLVTLIDTILELSTVFDRPSISEKGFAGYTTVLEYDNDKAFMLQVCYNEMMPNMGVYVHFSGQAFSKYLFTRDVIASKVIQDFKKLEDYYEGAAHISRIDIAIDFLDEGLSVATIYDRLVSEVDYLVDKNDRKNSSKISAVVNNQIVSTIYVGSKKKNTRLLMRIYDKKLEQLDNAQHATHYTEAKHCDDWVRFEASFRQMYAHQISEELVKIETKEELSGFLFSTFCEKYRFYNVFDETYTTLTKVMLAYSDGLSDILDGRKPQESNLEVSINYLCTGSGLMPTFYKIYDFYGQKGINNFIGYLFDYYNNAYDANKDAYNYIMKYREEYQGRKKFPWRDLSLKGGEKDGKS